MAENNISQCNDLAKKLKAVPSVAGEESGVALSLGWLRETMSVGINRRII